MKAFDSTFPSKVQGNFKQMVAIEASAPSLWFTEPTDETNNPSSRWSTLDNHHYPYRSFYQADVLINGHLKAHWNTSWTKFVAVNELILGLAVFIIGILIVFFQLSLAFTAHGIWTGVLVFLAGLFAFFTIISRRHRFFLVVASIHFLVSLASTILIFISVFALAVQINHHFSREDRQLNYALHITLIVLGLYEKLLCYSFLIMIIRHTHKMV